MKRYLLVEIIFDKIKPLPEFGEYLNCRDGRDDENLKPLKEILIAFLTMEDALKLFGRIPSLSPKFPGKILKGVLERCIEFHEFGIENQRYYDLRPPQYSYCGKRRYYPDLRAKKYGKNVKRRRYNLRSK